MNTVIIVIALLLLAGCSTGNLEPQPLPRPTAVEYKGRVVAVDGWVTFRGIDIPYIQAGKAPALTLSVPRVKWPLLTAPVVLRLDALGLTTRTDAETRRVLTVIIAETGLNSGPE